MMWVNIKIAGKWMFIPLKMVLIGIDPYPCGFIPSKDEMPSLKKKNGVASNCSYFWAIGIQDIGELD